MNNMMLNRERNLFKKITNIYIFFIIIIFPLIVDNTGFFKILECKWHTYLYISIIYYSIILIIFLYYLLLKKINYFSNMKINKMQIAALSFILINILSCLFSPYLKTHNLLIGVGRGEGLIMMTLYALSFLSIITFTNFKKKFILFFSISSILLSIIGILQYIGFNPFNMYQDGIGTHNVSFMITIGNIDFISALYSIFFSISFFSYIFLDNKRNETIIYFLSIFMSSFIICVINVDSGKLALLIVTIFLIPLVLIRSDRLARFIKTIAAILLVYCINIVINPEYHYSIHKLDLYFQFNYITLIYLFTIVGLLFVSKYLNKVDYDLSNKKSIIKKMYVFLLLSLLICFIIIFFTDFKSGMLGEIHSILHLNFDDKFGTYRMFLWKRSIKLIMDYPLLGSGPDTFALRFMAIYAKDVASIGELTINDTAANVYLTMIINIGVTGLISYLSIIYNSLKVAIKRKNKYINILLLSTIVYLIQDFFNLSVVIVTPVFWVLLGLLGLSYKNCVDK